MGTLPGIEVGDELTGELFEIKKLLSKGVGCNMDWSKAGAICKSRRGRPGLRLRGIIVFGELVPSHNECYSFKFCECNRHHLKEKQCEM